MLIAIDGPAASGKGTLPAGSSPRIGLPILTPASSTAQLRGIPLAARHAPSEADAALAAANALDPATLDDPKLMEGRLGEAASIVASHPGVGEALRAYQRAFAGQVSGAVIDGRDIGTVICPDADVKLFVTASAETRALRRYRELREAGHGVTEAEVLADIRRRDERDKTRAISPLRKARDAYLPTPTNLDIDAAFKAAIALIDAAMGRAGRAG